MVDILEYLVEVVEYIPTNVINVGLISYLVWFSKTHTEEHRVILEKIYVNKKWLISSEGEYNKDRELMLKGLITNDNLPDFIRLDFYKEYKKMGGNSWVDNYVEDNIIGVGGNKGRRKTDIDDCKKEL